MVLSLQSLPSRSQLLPVTHRRILRPSPPSTAFWSPVRGFPVDRARRQRSISLCQPHSTTAHPSRVGVPTLLPDALGCRPSTAGGRGATLSTFPLVPLTCEPTCTQAIDQGFSGQPSPLRTPHGRPGVQGVFSTSRGQAPHGWPMVHHPMATGFLIPRGCCLALSVPLPIPCSIPLCHIPSRAHFQRPVDSLPRRAVVRP